MEVIGIDVGFGFTKATNGSKNAIFKSILGDSTDIQFRSTLGDRSFSHNLHVTIDDHSYFVGDFAELQSNVRQFTLDQEKLLAEFIKVLALTAAGCCYETSGSINVVSGLPVSYLKRDYNRFSEILRGHHTIIFELPDGGTSSRSLYIQQVQMLPQPLGSIFNLLMNEKGKIVRKDLATQKIGVVDIGFRTTDFSIFDHLRYVERGSSTLDTGISKCFDIISKKLWQESGVNIELFRLYKAVESGMIKIKGKEYNITHLRDKVYAHTAGIMAGAINRLWIDDWDIDAIILTGGGSMALAEHLEPLLDGNVIPMENDIDARLNNVQGYLKYGRHKWASQTEKFSDQPTTDEPEAPELPKPQKKKWLKK